MTPHEVLGLDHDATLEDAEAAYYRLLRVHHPDLHQDEGPDAIAAAEARTRALNLAMLRLRAEHAGPAQAERDGDPAPDPATDSADSAGAAPDFASGPGAEPPGPDASSEASWDDRPPPVWGACPFCGDLFADARVLKQHVATIHKVHLDGRPRRRRRRRSRIGRALARWQFVSLWYLVPFNALVALLLATAVASLDIWLSYWVFAVAMAPTFILVMSRGIGPRS